MGSFHVSFPTDLAGLESARVGRAEASRHRLPAGGSGGGGGPGLLLRRGAAAGGSGRSCLGGCRPSGS